MSDLVQFARRLESRLTAANLVPHWASDEAQRYMAEVTTRRERFEKLARRLTETVIQPRLETLAGYFANAYLTENEPLGHCTCWFGYCERFPASTKVALAVQHDVRFEKVAVCYEASMMPVFIKLDEHDKLTSPLDDLQNDAVADWVEERLLEFLDAYQRIDRGGEEFDEEAATDPVCGMRISRSSAVASDSYRGHPYFFCSSECQERFAREPKAYVEVKTM
ncbi:MAG: YHS domain-containing protein [Planctomycetota bacterium]|nr:YHS domain-containing protein [Planctomycetota bacterium]